MGKYIGYTFLILIILFALEWFQVFDVPYMEIPDWTSGKNEMAKSTEDSLEQIDK